MLVKSLDAKIRPPAPGQEKTSLLGAARIYVSKDSFISLTGNLESGRHCSIEKLDPPEEADTASPPLRREASLCVVSEKNLSPNIVVMSRAFQDATGFKVGDKIRITLLASEMPDAESVVLQETGAFEEVKTKTPLSWESATELSLGLFLD
jgi:AAA family ATPase